MKQMTNRPWYQFIRCWFRPHNYKLTLIPGVDRYIGKHWRCLHCDHSFIEKEIE